LILEQLILAHNTGRNVIPNSMELTTEIIAEFVFAEKSSGRDVKNKNKVMVDYQYPTPGAGQ